MDMGDLNGQTAYDLYENQGYTQSQIGEMYDCDQSHVSRLIKSYREGMDDGREKGKQEADPTGFSRDELERALQDKVEDDDTYTCAECGKTIEYLQENCTCGLTLDWSGM